MINAPIWGEGVPAPPLPLLEGDVSADVCVVGLGGAGLACIGELLRGGVSVVGIDAVGIAGGAAGRNGGFLMGGMSLFHHVAVERLGRERASAIYRATLDELERIVIETPEAVRRTGSLRIAVSADEEADCDRQLHAMQADSLPVERYEGPEGCGLLFPRDAAFDPAARCGKLALSATERGASLFVQSPAVSLERGCVRTPHGSVHAARIIVAVDGGLERILPELAPRVRSARLQILSTEPLPTVRWSRPVYTRWGLDYWQQRADRRVVIGGCRDVGGDDEWTTSNEPTEVVQDAITKLLRDKLGVSARVTHRWAATVSYAESGLPIVEEVRPGVWGVGAYSGTGNVVGAVCAKAVAQLALSGRSEVAELFRA
jgi:glycine/D-amino acid oxidase-like deaminating enzyme